MTTQTPFPSHDSEPRIEIRSTQRRRVDSVDVSQLVHMRKHSTVVRRVTRIGLAANILLSALKMIGGVLGSSQAVIADAIHSLSDCATDIAILVGVKYWSQPPDEDHPYGHQRIETAITIFIGVVLVLVAVGLIYDGIDNLLHPPDASPGLVALGAALVSILTKELLYRWTRKSGKRIKSSALVANAWHQRSDALSSFPAGAAVAACYFNPSLNFLDGVGAIVVSFFILHAAWRIVAPGIAQLTDKGAEKEDRENIRRLSLEIDQVQDVHKIRTRFSGLGLQVDLHVLVDGTLSVCQGHEIAGAVKARLLSECNEVVDVIVHVEPYEDCASSSS